MATEVLFEVSWEVCNKVGGIYTVVRSKIPFIKPHYQEYVLIGPAFDVNPEFEPRPASSAWQEIFAAAERRGLKCHYGVWLVPGEPITILIESRALVDKKNEIKAKLWEQYKIDSLRSAWEFEEPMCFATAAGILIEEYAKRNEKQIVAQCHEWISGFAVLHLRDAGVKVGTVFTTHATMLGRTLAANGHPLYEMLENINSAEWAYRYNVQDKHLTEVACAHAADVFTTVSEITGLEAEKLLGRKPDVLLFNGFYTEKLPTFEETSLRHSHSKRALHELIAYTFFPHYTFNLDKTLIFFTSGRYEFQNKGIDVFIESLGMLNEKLKAENADVTIVAFFWIIMGRNNPHMQLLENKNFYTNLRSAVEWQTKALQQKIILDLLSGHKPGENDIFTSAFMQDLHEDVRHFKRRGEPITVTHEISYPDPTLEACKAHGLLNRVEDKVKVILYPGYLDGTDGVLNLQYYDATVGAHLGVFPSSYEPWGYTPLESVVLGVPAITTDLAGFGRYMEANRTMSKGVCVLKRMNTRREDVVRNLSQELHRFAKSSHTERVQEGFAAKELATLCDWRIFIKHYLTAHNLATRKWQS
jgi:glycogen synthase